MKPNQKAGPGHRKLEAQRGQDASADVEGRVRAGMPRAAAPRRRAAADPRQDLKAEKARRPRSSHG